MSNQFHIYVLIPNIYRSFLFLLVHIISSETTTIKITTHVLNTAPIIMPGLMLLVSVLPLLSSVLLISMVSLVVGGMFVTSEII